MKRLSALVIATLIGLFALARSSDAVPIDALDPTRQWRVERIEISGNRAFSDGELKEVIVTRERPWYRFWEERPAFDPITFGTDIERLQRYYEARGYYDTSVAYDLDVDDERGLVAARVEIREGLPPVSIAAIDVEVAADPQDPKPPPLPEELPVKRGEPFGEAEYQQAEQVLRAAYLRRGHAHVKSERRAEVDLAERTARIRYSIEPGPVAAFGQTTVQGTETVAPELVSREVTYKAGETYSLDRIAETRDNIVALDLFSSVRIAPAETAGMPAVVPMEIQVAEKSHREVRIGLGYGTEDEFRAQLEWRHLNWLGGGRRLSVGAKYSSIALSGAVNFVQPHLFSPRTQGQASFSHELEKEETYNRNVTRVSPRLNHRFLPALTGFVGYRVEYNHLSDIAEATVQEVGGIRRKGILSGPSVGLLWNTSDDPFYPKRGEVVSLVVDHAGGPWGGKFNFYKITAEAKKYVEIGWQAVLAGRLKLGFADAIGSDKNYPLFERFYAGGEKSVRGYGRRRLGPLSASNDPLGGLSLLEGSLELRRPIWKELGGAVFLDFGQVSKRSFDLPADNLRFSSGFGLSYATPIGPLRLDVGFPFKKPPGDKPWQIHFSIGAFF